MLTYFDVPADLGRSAAADGPWRAVAKPPEQASPDDVAKVGDGVRDSRKECPRRPVSGRITAVIRASKRVVRKE